MCAVNPVGDGFLINAVCHLALVTSSSSSDICVFYASLVFGIDGSYLGLFYACAVLTF